MKITVTWFHPTKQGLEIWFNEQIYNEKANEYTPLGLRAWRILSLFAPSAYIHSRVYDSGGRALLLEGVFKSITGLENGLQVQAQMDKYANIDLLSQFLWNHVLWFEEGGYGAGNIVQDMQQFNQLLAQNKVIRLEVLFQLSLPVQNDDLNRLYAVLPRQHSEVFAVSECAHGMKVRVAYAGDIARIGKNPWTMIEEIKTSIRQALAG